MLDYSGSEEVEVVDLCWLVLHSYRSKFYLILLLPLSIKFSYVRDNPVWHGLKLERFPACGEGSATSM